MLRQTIAKQPVNNGVLRCYSVSAVVASRCEHVHARRHRRHQTDQVDYGAD